MSDQTEQQSSNLALTRRAFEAFNTGEADAGLGFADEDVEIYMPPDLPNSGTFHGHEGYLEWLGAWLEAWTEFTVEVRGLKPVGTRHVVVDVHQRAIGQGSGIEVEMDMAYMTEVSGEKIVAMHLYPRQEDALRVAEQREVG